MNRETQRGLYLLRALARLPYAVGLLLCVGGLFQLLQAVQSSRTLFSQGVQAYAAEDYEGAMKLLEQAIAAEPAVSEYYQWLGKATDSIRKQPVRPLWLVPATSSRLRNPQPRTPEHLVKITSERIAPLGEAETDRPRRAGARRHTADVRARAADTGRAVFLCSYQKGYGAFTCSLAESSGCCLRPRRFFPGPSARSKSYMYLARFTPLLWHPGPIARS